MAGEAKDITEEEEFEMVGDGVDTVKEPVEEDEGEEKKAAKETATDDDEAGHIDEEENDGKPSASKRRRERHKASKDRNYRELKFLRDRNAQLERRFSEMESRIGNAEVGNLTSQRKKLESDIRMADEVMAEAMEQSKPQDFMEAQRIRDDLRDQLAQIKAQESYTTRSQQQARQGRLSPEQEAVVEYANDFVERMPWLDLNDRNNKDTQAVTRLDNQLIREGYSPSTPEYWDELEERVKKTLPNYFDDSDNLNEDKPNGNGNGKVKRKVNGPTMVSGGQEKELKPNQVYISKERREAMEAAGVWEDPVLRKRYLKRYADYDREHNLT